MALEKQALIDMLNKDLADEHISVIRYLVHAYQAGETTPLGAMLLAMAREEMWHMDWLGDLLGELGTEPDMAPGIYPHDPTSNATLLRSYIAWEDNLIVAYARQADQVDDPEVKRVLMQQSIESSVHSRRFAKMLESLGAEAEQPLVYADVLQPPDAGGFSPKMVNRLQREMSDEYRLMLQHLRDAFVFEDAGPISGELEMTAMRHMKHLSHFAEELADSGHTPAFIPPQLATDRALEPALERNLELTEQAKERFEALLQEEELAEHRGLRIEVEHMVNQEVFLAERVEEMLEGLPEEGPPGTARPAGTFTVGSLLDQKEE